LSVVEGGQLRVDLLGTTGYNHEMVRRPGAMPSFIPQKLTAEQITQIQASEAAGSKIDKR
jgi:hypothetical protein